MKLDKTELELDPIFNKYPKIKIHSHQFYSEGYLVGFIRENDSVVGFRTLSGNRYDFGTYSYEFYDAGR